MKNIIAGFLLLITALGLPVRALAGADYSFAHETKAQHDARMQWFREARFGMFIHWGLYSQAAGYWNGKPVDGMGEWLMNDVPIPDSQYAKLIPKFNPVKFNALDWVRTAKAAGMKYIVITTKHHDGFGMYPSQLTDWCIKSTPFKRDPLKELAAACRQEGVKLCFYHSIMDWHHPDYLPRKPWNDLANPHAKFEDYETYLKGQLKELLTNYGPIGLLWFDGDWEDTWNNERGIDLYKYVRGLQPDLIVNNRVGKDGIGDYGTPEQTIPANGYGPGVDWETCMTMNGTWGFKRQDNDWKTTATLLYNLVDIASKGGNYLLNVGPTGEGLLPATSIKRLKEVGQWMDVNGEAIYGTTASPFPKQLPWGRCTKRVEGDTTTLYLHVFDWPADGRLLVPGLHTAADSAALLTDQAKPLVTATNDDGLLVSVPATAPDRISSTLVLKFSTPLVILSRPIMQKADGSVSLPAILAQLHGDSLQFEAGTNHDNIGFWFQAADWVDWNLTVKQPGKYRVTAEIAGPALTSFDVTVAGQTLRSTAPVTENYDSYQTVTLGTVELKEPGQVTLAVHPIATGWQPMNLRSITLTPAPVPPPAPANP